jgi:hypothetical protein
MSFLGPIGPLTQGIIVDLRCDVVFISLFLLSSFFSVASRSNDEVIGHLHLESIAATEAIFPRMKIVCGPDGSGGFEFRLQ